MREPAGACLAAPVLARQPAAGERRERREAEALIGAQRQHLGLGRAVEQAVARLHPLEAREPAHVADPERAREPPGLDVAGADVEQLARAAQVVERARASPRAASPDRARGIRKRSSRSAPRRVEARVDLRARAPGARGRGRSGPSPTGLNAFVLSSTWSRTAEPLLREPLADRRLAAAAAVGVGRVEDVDADLEGGVHDRERLVVALALAVELGRGADAAEVAAAERDARDLEPGAAERSDSPWRS